MPPRERPRESPQSLGEPDGVRSEGAERLGSGRTRAALLAVAADVFAEKGYEGAGLQEIARRAGLTTGAIYSNFAHKSGLLLAVIDESAATLLDAMKSSTARDLRPRELFRMWTGRLVQPSTTRMRSLFLEVVTAARREDAARRQVGRGLAEVRARVAGVVERAQAEGALSPLADGDAIAYLLLALSFGSYVLEGAGVPPPDAQRWQELMDLLSATLDDAG